MASKAYTNSSDTTRVCLLLVFLITVLSGCNRCFYRQQADRDVACMVSEKSNDPRWALQNFNINIDPRSRYFDPYSAECPPMPEDDPNSHRLMHCIDGKKGWKHWHRNGSRPELENPIWRERLGEYAPINENGDIVLSLDSALQIAYIHSPDHQRVVETIYLSALDVTTERFRFDTQFFGGTNLFYNLTGDLDGSNQKTLTNDTNLRANKLFATAGTMLVNFANEVTWEFTSGQSRVVSSLVNVAILQPLLRGAGRDIALEQLTIVERALLANLRAYAQWRQGFYTDVVVGDGSVPGPSRRGGFFGGTGLSGFTGQGAGGFGGVGNATGFGGGGFGGGGGTGATGGFAGGGAGNVGGFLGLLQSLQEIRNSRASLNLQLRTLDLLESSLDAGIIDLTQVDQFRQSIETEKATLLQSENGLKNSLEAYKTGTLGLPPDLPITLDDSLIEPFQLIESATTDLQDAIADEQARLGNIPADGDITSSVTAAANLVTQFQGVLADVDNDVQSIRDSRDQREGTMTDAEQSLFRKDIKDLEGNLENLRERFNELADRREKIEQGLDPTEQSNQLVVWLRQLFDIVQEIALVQARAKVESLAVDPVELSPEDAFDIALANRLDIMNNRASLVDIWRLIQFNADALQSDLSISLNGSLGTTDFNPLNISEKTGTLSAGVQFDAPFTRLLERNNFRQQLIEYQRARRGLIQSYDGVFFGLRSRLRNLEQLRVNLEIQRRAAIIAIRRVDLTRENLNEPQAPAQPGQPASQLGPTAATNLLTALRDLRATQNNFMSVYLNYYANRMLLARDLGTMILDPEGRWVDAPLTGYSPDSTMMMGMESVEEDYQQLVPPPLPAQLQEIITSPAKSNGDALPSVEYVPQSEYTPQAEYAPPAQPANPTQSRASVLQVKAPYQQVAPMTPGI